VRILHACLSCFYIDDASYQENELVQQHIALGHEVRVLASTEMISKTGQITYVEPREYMGSDGAVVKRLPYRRGLPQKIMRKLRLHPGVYREISEFAPDVILFHGASGWELLTVAKYAKNHPNVRFFIDSHEDANNSARGFISRELLHKRYYGPLLRRAAKTENPILCISLESMDFIHETYGIARDQLEFFPLGGRPLPDADYTRTRTAWRTKLGVADNQIMFLQSGKFDRLKRLLPSLKAFTATPDSAFRLFISGIIAKDENEAEIQTLIQSDSRIKFLGWNNPEAMVGLLAATDVYLQPGSQSVTMQNSICQRCAVIIDNVKSHQPFVDGNGFLTQGGTDLDQIMGKISAQKHAIAAMQKRSHEIALELLDYSKMALRVI